MNVVRHAADFQKFDFILAGNAADIWIKSGGKFGRDEIAPLFRAENAVYQLTVERMRHIFQMLSRQSRHLLTNNNFQIICIKNPIGIFDNSPMLQHWVLI